MLTVSFRRLAVSVDADVAVRALEAGVSDYFYISPLA